MQPNTDILTTHQYNLRFILSNSPSHRGMRRHRDKKEAFFTEVTAITKLNRLFLTIEGFTMPRKARDRSFQKFSVVFAQIHLTAADKPDFEMWMKEQGSEIFSMLIDLASGGWKCSFGEDYQNECYIVSHTQQIEDDPNYNTCCTSRSEDLTEALMLNCYKILRMFPNKRLPTEQTTRKWG